MADTALHSPHPQKAARPRLFLILAVLFTILSSLVLLLNLPIGVRGEWTWAYAPYPPWVGMLQVLPVIIGFIAVIYYGFRSAEQMTAAGRFGWVVVASAVFTAVCCSTVYLRQFERYELYFMMVSPNTNGVFFEDAHMMKDVRSYLCNYEEKLSRQVSEKRSVRHLSNPPGIAVFLHLLIQPLRANRSTSLQLGDALDPGDATWGVQQRDLPPNSWDRWRLRTAKVMVVSFAMFVMTGLLLLPAYYLSLEFTGIRVAPLVAGLAVLIPSIHVFNPNKDAVQLVFILWMWYAALRAAGTGRVVWSILSGVMFYAGLFFTMMCIPAAAFVFAVIVLHILTRQYPRKWLEEHGRRTMRLCLFGGVGILIPGIVVYLWSGYNPVTILLQSLRGEESFYAGYTRTYSAWIFMNVVDWFFMSGGIMSALVMTAVIVQIRDARRQGRTVIDPYLWGGLLTMLSLNLAGIPLSETGRIWLFLAPPVLIAAWRLCWTDSSLTNRTCLWLLALAGWQVIFYHLLFDVWEASTRIGSVGSRLFG